MAPDNIDFIRDMWSQGATGTQIAKHLGCTRNAVIGVVFRARQRGEQWAAERKEPAGRTAIKHALRVTRPQKPRVVHTPVAQPARVRAPTINPQKPKVREHVAVESLNVPFLELQPFQCRAITDDTRFAQRCCGQVRDEDSPYCADHRALYSAPAQGKAA